VPIKPIKSKSALAAEACFSMNLTAIARFSAASLGPGCHFHVLGRRNPP
jgi:hypothetical protein